MKQLAFVVGVLAWSSAQGQTGTAVPYKPKPAFPGQTEAPAPAKLSAPFTMQTITNRLSGPWSLAFLPEGNFLVTEGAGTMRIVLPDGVVSAPIAGVPGVKVIAAQGLHDVMLDPDFARNRLLYITYFAPPRGEDPALWPNDFFYEQVWTKSLAERRTMNLGMERVARARLSDDNKRLEDFRILIDGGGERRIVLARDGTLLVTGADRFRFYDSDLDGVEHAFTDTPDIRRHFSGRVIRIATESNSHRWWLSSQALGGRPADEADAETLRRAIVLQYGARRRDCSASSMSSLNATKKGSTSLRCYSFRGATHKRAPWTKSRSAFAKPLNCALR